MRISSIALADINNNGMVDILVGSYVASDHLLINRDDGNFDDLIDLPGGTLSTISIASADLNCDGMVDILIGNGSGQMNQFLPNNVCPHGGDKMHAKSWCFKCPSFMGYDSATSVCKECPPGFLQQLGSSEECGLQCLGKQRMLGDNEMLKVSW